jgi:hypothetical protein
VRPSRVLLLGHGLHQCARFSGSRVPITVKLFYLLLSVTLLLHWGYLSLHQRAHLLYYLETCLVPCLHGHSHLLSCYQWDYYATWSGVPS